MNMKFSLGNSIARTEDRRLLTGKGNYADDVTLPKQAYAAMIRSPHAHARILSVDTEAVADMQGVLCVLTAKDWDDDGLGALFAFSNFLPDPLLLPDGRAFVNPLRKPMAFCSSRPLAASRRRYSLNTLALGRYSVSTPNVVKRAPSPCPSP